MKISLFGLLGLMSISAFAQVASPIANVTPSTQTALTETKCLNNVGRGHATIELTGRKDIKGEHIGITSHGDVAVITNNKTLDLYVCYRDRAGRQGTVSNINLVDAGKCSVGEIASLNLFMDNGDNFAFRSLAFNPETSLCNSKTTQVSDVDRDVVKGDIGVVTVPGDATVTKK